MHATKLNAGNYQECKKISNKINVPVIFTLKKQFASDHVILRTHYRDSKPISLCLVLHKAACLAENTNCIFLIGPDQYDILHSNYYTTDMG